MPVETVVARPRSPVSVTLELRQHRLVQDKPQASGGQDAGPMASELLLAGLLACQHSTIVKVAAKRRVQATVRSIQGDMHFDAAGDIARIDLAFDLETPPGTRAEAIEALLRLTEAACTISKALKVPVASRLATA